MLPLIAEKQTYGAGGNARVGGTCSILVCCAEREERERAERAKREEELREYQERVKKLEEVERKKRQRELEIEERERRREEERRLGDDSLSRKVTVAVSVLCCVVSARSLHDRAVHACVSVWAWCFELHRSDLSLVLLYLSKEGS